ncbi:Maf family protein [Actinomarinicola tropica]|uniref:dTTP/UTP pyrophosphatase n=1 Tax=Actinomarinicola tropica TaxID=2789776 RepID=A0A5Q2RPF6_9ACTN|nr:nucleoside triphosphate pyrophosphatase [Actinomarinicola tropica]QGG96832.1 septum formation inhibitor Maf [Actinomarinicola tropica]
MLRPPAPLVLASASPRRLDLLRQAGVEPAVEPADVDETSPPGATPESLAVGLARTKAQEVAAGHAGEDLVVLGADTVVVVDGRILGKPTDADDAARMLSALSGRTHHVVTGVALVDARTGRTVDGLARTDVRMRHLDAEEVAAYVATGEPLDKAGAYGIQGLAAVFVEGIEGDYTNVVGLPLPLVDVLLRQLDGPA